MSLIPFQPSSQLLIRLILSARFLYLVSSIYTLIPQNLYLLLVGLHLFQSLFPIPHRHLYLGQSQLSLQLHIHFPLVLQLSQNLRFHPLIGSYLLFSNYDAIEYTTSFFTDSDANARHAIIASLLILGYALNKSSTVSPSDIFSNIKSTGILVFFITGLPYNFLGFDSIYSCQFIIILAL